MYRFLSLANADPRLVIGFQNADDGVIGHAWVVVDGSPLYEGLGAVGNYAVIAEFAADGFPAS